jgi:hypothetical protein
MKGDLGGTVMKHFTTEEWIDFVNQVASSTQHGAMKKHLESGCKRCADTVTLWEKIRKMAASEPSFQPSTEAVLAAKSAFATAAWAFQAKRSGSLVELLFDSFLQPALAGARSAGAGVRQMLYRADPYQVDMQIESKPGGNLLVITGQLLSVSHQESMGSDVQVKLSNRRGSIVQMTTNKFGEFRGEIENSGDLELSFPRPEDGPIVISLRNALDRTPGGKA